MHEGQIGNVAQNRLSADSTRARIVCSVSLGHQGLCVDVSVHIAERLNGCE